MYEIHGWGECTDSFAQGGDNSLTYCSFSPGEPAEQVAYPGNRGWVKAVVRKDQAVETFLDGGEEAQGA